MENPFEQITNRLTAIESLLLDIKHAPKDPPDRMTIDDLVSEFGFSKPFVYKETSIHGTKNMPCRRFGNRLIFSRKEIVAWLASRTIRKQSPDEVASEKLQQAALKKQR